MRQPYVMVTGMPRTLVHNVAVFMDNETPAAVDYRPADTHDTWPIQIHLGHPEQTMDIWCAVDTATALRDALTAALEQGEQAR